MQTMNEQPYPYKTESQGGLTFGYSVEIRSGGRVIDQQGMVADEHWRRVSFPESRGGGVPRGEWMVDAIGLLSYPGAQALRWWVHAEFEKDYRGSPLETRIVKHRITYSVESEAISAHLVIGGIDRSHEEPDWKGVKVNASTVPC